MTVRVVPLVTNDNAVVEKYNQCVGPIPGVDITDDYVSERKECERKGYQLSQYKWLAKCVLGSKN